MDREIKFRAWNTEFFRMERFVKVGEDSMKDKYSQNLPSDSIAMQFTGIKDRTGKEIYEGDILDLSDGPAKVVYVDYAASYEVIFVDEANLGLWEACGHGRDLPHIIGNIFENPELFV